MSRRNRTKAAPTTPKVADLSQPELRDLIQRKAQQYRQGVEAILSGGKATRPAPKAQGATQPLLQLAEVAKGMISWEGLPGTSDGEMDFGARASRSGIPSNRGIPYLDKNPDLSAYSARGLGSDPGEWFEVSKLPEVEATLRRIREILGTTPLRLDPPALPKWATAADRARAKVQFDLASRWWWAWTQKSEGGLHSWVRDVLRIAPVCGFILGEVIASEESHDLDGLEITALSPSAPQSIMPWSVRHWVSDETEWVGTLFDFSQSADYSGNRGGFLDYLPREKLVLVRNNALADMMEGESIMRAAWEQILQLGELYRLQALGAEVHALGELWFVREQGSGTQGSAAVQGSPAEDAAMERILSSRRAHYVPGAVLPPGVEPVYGQANANLPNLTPMIENLRQAISLALGSDDLLIAFQQSGSYAAKQTASEDKNKSLESLIETLIARPLEDLLARFLSYAFPDSKIYSPKVSWGAAEERDLSTWIDNVGKAKSAGLLEDPDFGDIIREELGLPPRVGAAAPDATPAPLAVPAPGEAPAEAAQAAQANTPPDLGAHLIDPSEVASRWNISRASVISLLKGRQIKGHKVGSRWRVDAASVSEYLKSLVDEPVR